MGLPGIILKGEQLRTISPKFDLNCPSSFRGEKFLMFFFAKFSIFSNGGHHGWWAESLDIILKRAYQKTIPAKLNLNWRNGFRGEDLKS